MLRVDYPPGVDMLFESLSRRRLAIVFLSLAAVLAVQSLGVPSASSPTK